LLPVQENLKNIIPQCPSVKSWLTKTGNTAGYTYTGNKFSSLNRGRRLKENKAVLVTDTIDCIPAEEL
jgi:hypothetical protein